MDIDAIKKKYYGTVSHEDAPKDLGIVISEVERLQAELDRARKELITRYDQNGWILPSWTQQQKENAKLRAELEQLRKQTSNEIEENAIHLHRRNQLKEKLATLQAQLDESEAQRRKAEHRIMELEINAMAIVRVRNWMKVYNVKSFDKYKTSLNELIDKFDALTENQTEQEGTR